MTRVGRRGANGWGGLALDDVGAASVGCERFAADCLAEVGLGERVGRLAARLKLLPARSEEGVTQRRRLGPAGARTRHRFADVQVRARRGDLGHPGARVTRCGRGLAVALDELEDFCGGHVDEEHLRSRSADELVPT